MITTPQTKISVIPREREREIKFFDIFGDDQSPIFRVEIEFRVSELKEFSELELIHQRKISISLIFSGRTVV